MKLMHTTPDPDRQLPVLAADLTWVKVNGGHATSALADWDEDHAPSAGEHVRVSDGGPFLEAVIVAVADDGTIHLSLPAFAREVRQVS